MRTAVRRSGNNERAVYRITGIVAAASSPAGRSTWRARVGVKYRCAIGFSQGFNQLQQGYAGLASDYIEFARRRYQASAQSRDIVFMMTHDENLGLALVQVSKLSGQILGAIDLGRDKEPNYQIDDIANQIFYLPSDSTIVSYRFQNASTNFAQATP